MKKVLLLSATIAALFTSAQAQVRIAPELGLNINSLGYDAIPFAGIQIPVENKMSIGFRAGALVEIGLSDKFYLQPGLFYSLKGGKATTDNIFGIPVDFEAKTNLHYIDVPVMFTYKTGTEGSGRFYVGVGPSVGIALAGKTEWTGTSLVGSLDSSFTTEFGSANAETKRIDIAANIKAGYELPMGLYFGAFYSMGFIDLSNDEFTTPSAKNMNFGINIGYRLGGNGKAKKSPAAGE